MRLKATSPAKRRKLDVPRTPSDAADQFRALTGIDLATDPACVAVAEVLETWRAALAFVEYEPLVEAILEAQERIGERSVGAIPKLTPVARQGKPSELHVATAGLVDSFNDGIQSIHDGVVRVSRGIEWARATGLVPRKRTGRPRETLDGALCVLMVDYWERRERRPQVSSTQVALAAFAYGIAKPKGDWRAWSERWRRLLKRARAVKPGPFKPEARVLAYSNKPPRNS